MGSHYTLTTEPLTTVNPKSDYIYDINTTYSYIEPGSIIPNNTLIWKATSPLPSGLQLTYRPTSKEGNYVSTYADSNTPISAVIALTVDNRGNVYTTNANANELQKIDTNGTVTTINHPFYMLYAMASDPNSGVVYANDYRGSIIYKIDTNGSVSQLTSGINITAMDVNSKGIIYAVTGSNILYKITPDGTMTSFSIAVNEDVLSFRSLTISDNDLIGKKDLIYLGDTSRNCMIELYDDATLSTFKYLSFSPDVLSAYRSNLFYVTSFFDSNIQPDNQIRLLEFEESQDPRSIPLTGTHGAGYQDGPAEDAKFSRIFAMDSDKDGALYLADSYNNLIRKVSSLHYTLQGKAPNTPGLYDINLSVTGGTTDSPWSEKYSYVLRVKGSIISKNTLSENNDMGDIIGHISTIGEDINNTFTYSFCGGIDDSAFQLNDNNLSAAIIFDYEAKNSYSLCIRATDNNGTIYDGNFTIEITDTNDAPEVTSSPITTINTDTAYDYTLKGSDLEGAYTSWHLASGTSLASWLTFTPASWQSVGVADFSVGNVSYSDTVLDTNNVPYIAFADGSNTNKATVMKFDGTSWQLVGNAGFSAGSVTDISMVLGSDNTPYITYKDSALGNMAVVMTYKNSSWQEVGSTSLNTTYVNYPSLAIDSSDILYLAYTDYANRAAVKKFNGTSWVRVGNGTLSSYKATYTTIVIDGNDTPYVSYQDSSFGFKAVVKKFNGLSWSNVGFPAFSAGYAVGLNMAIDNHNVPYVTFADEANGYRATVMKFDANSWQSVGSLDNSYNMGVGNALAFDSNNVPYMAYKNSYSTSKATVVRFNGTYWQSIGNLNNISGVISTSLVIDSNDIPYVTFSNTSTKASLMKFNPISTLRGTSPNTAGLYDVNLTLSDGKTTTPHNFQIEVITPPPPPAPKPTNSSSSSNSSASSTPSEQFFSTATDGIVSTLHTNGTTISNEVIENGIIFNATKDGSGNISTQVTTPDGLTLSSSTLDVSTTFVRDESGNVVIKTLSSFTNSDNRAVLLQTSIDSTGVIEVQMQIDSTDTKASNTLLKAPSGSEVFSNENGRVELRVSNRSESCSETYKEVRILVQSDGSSVVHMQTFKCDGTLLDNANTLSMSDNFHQGATIEVQKAVDGKLHVVITTTLDGTLQF